MILSIPVIILAGLLFGDLSKKLEGKNGILRHQFKTISYILFAIAAILVVLLPSVTETYVNNL